MAQAFSRTEFRGLCLELNVNPDEPPETTLTGQCAWLIQHLQGDGRLPKLLALLKRERPHIDWQRPSVPTGRDMRNRLNVLQNIQATWIEGYLHQSLAEAVALELNLRHEPTAVARKTLTAPGQSEMPAEDVREVFEAYGRALLILGDPGSGKTITLLQLAETLIAEAQHDPSQPIPVVLNLASWVQAQKPLTEWLVEEIFIQYQVARQLTRQWIGQNLWLYLLDGLDEVAEDVRDDCVAAINAFKAENPAELVVCSRVGDYEKLQEKLNLGTAVRLQALSAEQIQTYLNRDDVQLTAVREAIITDADLHELAHTPLFLSMMTLAYGGRSLEQMDTFDSMAVKYNHLFATYVAEMFRRRPLPPNSRYSQEQARHWLAHLAAGLQRHGQTTFYIERLQPTWLNWPASWLHLLLVAFICGAMAGTLWGLIDALETSSFRNSLLNGLLYSLTSGFSVAIGVRMSAKIKNNLLRVGASGFLSWFSFALIGVVVTAVIQFSRPFSSATLPEWLVLGLLRGWNSLLIGCLIAYKLEIENIERIVFSWPTRGILAKALRNGILYGVLSGLGIGLTLGTIAALVYNLTVQQEFPPIVGLFVSFIWGGCIGILGMGLGVLVGGFLAIFNACLQRQEIDQKLRPNEGMLNTLKSTLTVLLLMIVPVGLLLWLVSSWAGNQGIRFVFFFVYLALPFAFFYLGGLALIQHVSLRLLLVWEGVLPHPRVAWLDDMTTHILLRRVGGGWVFIHRALLEYFAALHPDSSQSSD
ncbi:MAG TPA: NACHT domain-containing protein [Chloroflexota bacterium]|nr:NACHT domain-containing protein [Chloroflexota bacterium]